MVQGRRSAPIEITLELQEEAGADAPEVEPAGFPPRTGVHERSESPRAFRQAGWYREPYRARPGNPRPGPGPV